VPVFFFFYPGKKGKQGGKKKDVGKEGQRETSGIKKKISQIAPKMFQQDGGERKWNQKDWTRKGGSGSVHTTPVHKKEGGEKTKTKT